MHTIEKKKIIPVIIPVTQFRSWKRGKFHFSRVQFYKFPGGACPRTPLGVRARGANGARPPAEPLHQVIPNATENPVICIYRQLEILATALITAYY